MVGGAGSSIQSAHCTVHCTRAGILCSSGLVELEETLDMLEVAESCLRTRLSKVYSGGNLFIRPEYPAHCHVSTLYQLHCLFVTFIDHDVFHVESVT
jgi:hypothetical protein